MRNRFVITIGSNETVFDAIQKLNKFGRGALPVLDDRAELIGIVPMRDLLDIQLSEVEAEVRYIGLIPRKTTRPVI